LTEFIVSTTASALFVWLMLLVAILLGALFGFILMHLPKIGVVYIGVWLGVLIAILFENSILYKFSGSGNALYYIFLVLASVIGGALSFSLLNDIIIICTSLLGVLVLVNIYFRLI
jgi:hypothetical protein